MLTVKREIVDELMTVWLNGAIDDEVDFFTLIGPPSKQLHVYCDEVSRINSVGIKNWIKYFSEQSAKGCQVVFYDCSPPIVDQMNMISNFVGGGTVESILVPYSCPEDQTLLLAKCTVAYLRDNGFQPPKIKSPATGHDAFFDDIPEEYFAFLMRPQ